MADDLLAAVPNGRKQAVRDLLALLRRAWSLADGWEVRVYGTYARKGARQWAVCEIDCWYPDHSTGTALMGSEPAALALLRAAEDFLETHGLRPYRPRGWTTDLDEHADAIYRLEVVLRQPSPEQLLALIRQLLEQAQKHPGTPVGALLDSATTSGGQTIRQALLACCSQEGRR